MSFDKIAPFYRAIEWTFAAGFLQRSRLAFLHKIPVPENVLFVGEGNGRCLAEFVKTYPSANFTCIDASATMLAIAEKRVAKQQTGSVDFVHADLLNWQTGKKFDLIVSHYFLDCFHADELEKVISHLVKTASPGSRWLIADFHEPQRGPSKWFANFLISSLYRFFRKTTGLKTQKLVSPDAFLNRFGFDLIHRRESFFGLLQSNLWQKR